MCLVYEKLGLLGSPQPPLKRGAKCFMFSLGEVEAAYIIIDGVSAGEKRKNYKSNGG